MYIMLLCLTDQSETGETTLHEWNDNLFVDIVQNIDTMLERERK